jgi:hypothetical protein
MQAAFDNASRVRFPERNAPPLDVPRDGRPAIFAAAPGIYLRARLIPDG